MAVLAAFAALAVCSVVMTTNYCFPLLATLPADYFSLALVKLAIYLLGHRVLISGWGLGPDAQPTLLPLRSGRGSRISGEVRAWLLFFALRHG